MNAALGRDFEFYIQSEKIELLDRQRRRWFPNLMMRIWNGEFITGDVGVRLSGGLDSSAEINDYLVSSVMNQQNDRWAGQTAEHVISCPVCRQQSPVSTLQTVDDAVNDEGETCLACQERAANVLFSNCIHVCLCSACADAWSKRIVQ